MLLVCALGGGVAEAQLSPPTSGGVVELDHLLQRLSEHRRLLLVGAHPDDEDTDLLTIMARRYGAEAAYLSLSRGEGGQNLIGPELGVELGLLRSSELLAARAIDGARQFFTRAYDFGYSRSVDETSGFWLPDTVLKDVVRIVRRFRPHIIVATFTGTPRDRHGQHQLAGVMARAAFDAAGDATRFPELATEEGLAVWTPLKLYQSARFDTTGTTVRLPAGELDPRLGRTYHQIAMASRSRHSSQDMGRLQRTGPAWSRLRLVVDRTGRSSGPEPERDIFDGIAQDTTSIARLADSLRGTTSAVRASDAAQALTAALAAADGGLDADRRWLVERAIGVSAGVVLDAYAERAALVPGERVPVTLELYNGGPYDLTVDAVEIAAPESWIVASAGFHRVSLAPGARVAHRFEVEIPSAARCTDPYFLVSPVVGALYDWSAAAPAHRGLPFDPPVLQARARIGVLGVQMNVEREVTYRYNDQATGEVRRELRVVPALDLRITPERVLWPTDGPVDRTFTVTVTNNGGAVSGIINIRADGWPMPEPQRFSFGAPGESRRFAFRVSRPPGIERAVVALSATARTADGRTFTKGVRTVSYPHIRAVSHVVPAAAKIQLAPIHLPTARAVGYVRGAADRVPEALAQVGLPVRILDAGALAAEPLEQFDAIVIGSRAYETDSALIEHNDRLLAYVKDGGLLVVQYQQYQFVRGGFAPYPFDIGRPHDRITDESSPVRTLETGHRVFQSPNRIGPTDWDGWPQERGLYFASTWDGAYTPLLEMRDPGRAPVRGGLLVAEYGAGTYVYTGLSFFRSLPAAVPGAFRLFLNLLDLSTPERQ